MRRYTVLFTFAEYIIVAMGLGSLGLVLLVIDEKSIVVSIILQCLNLLLACNMNGYLATLKTKNGVMMN